MINTYAPHACMPEHYVVIHTYLPLADMRLWRDRDMSMKRSEMRMLNLQSAICT